MDSTLTAHVASGSFDILEDIEQPSAEVQNELVTDTAGVFNELHIDNCQNQSLSKQHSQEIGKICDQLSKLDVTDSAEPKSIKSNVLPQSTRWQRPAINQQTFEPLATLQEDVKLTPKRAGKTAVEIHPKGNFFYPSNSISLTLTDMHLIDSETVDALQPILTGDAVQHQIAKHLAGQFEWLVSSLPGTYTTSNQDSSERKGTSRHASTLVYGCNMLPCKPRNTANVRLRSDHQQTDNYLLLATPLPAGTITPEQLQNPNQPLTMPWPHAPPPYQEAMLRVPEVLEALDSSVSPTLSGISERSGSFAMTSSPAGSCSLPRIEDSLAELDKLEDELEAIGDVTQFKRSAAPTENQVKTAAGSPSTRATPKLKRASTATMSPSQNKQVEKASPSLRRAASLTMRSKAHNTALPSTATRATPSKTAATMGKASATPKTLGTKSGKAPTVPKFELPGEAVARRLKEQREARQAQQEQARAATVSPSKPRTLTKPTFELPGEAISRRKREEHEAKLKAQQEEERKKREFKARPMRHSMAGESQPRETIASRARQAKAQQASAATTSTSAATKGMSVGPVMQAANRASESKTLQVRKRASMIVPSNAPREVNNSTATPRTSNIGAPSTSAKTLRRRSTMIDTLKDPKVREKQEKEEAIKLARKEAAERSRAASREWAEKQRRKQMAQAQS